MQGGEGGEGGRGKGHHFTIGNVRLCLVLLVECVVCVCVYVGVCVSPLSSPHFPRVTLRSELPGGRPAPAPQSKPWWAARPKAARLT